LFYFAVTRTRRNLIVLSNDNQEYLPKDSASVIIRNVIPNMDAFPGPRRYFKSAGAQMADLSFAGRQGHNHPALSAIADTGKSDLIALVFDKDRWHLKHTRGRIRTPSKHADCFR